jgi:hypothetical protein
MLNPSDEVETPRMTVAALHLWRPETAVVYGGSGIEGEVSFGLGYLVRWGAAGKTNRSEVSSKTGVFMF